MNPFVANDLLRLQTIAQEEGNPLLIDTDEEWGSAVSWLASLNQKRYTETTEREFAEALAELTALGPKGRFQVNFFFRGCTPEDCFSYFIPLPEEAAYGFFVASGGLGASNLDFVPVTPEDWRFITRPLAAHLASGPEEERGLIRDVVDRFEWAVAPKGDIPGMLGNFYSLFFPEGQQDCVDKTRTLSQLFNALKSVGLLHFNAWDIGNPFAGGPMNHMATRLVDATTRQVYVVDTWGGQIGETVIDSEEGWRMRNLSAFERPMP